MIDGLVLFALVLSLLQATVGLTFLISSMQEKEKRATLFGFFQFLILLLPVFLIFFLDQKGFFDTPLGIALLFLGLVAFGVSAFCLVRRSGENEKALQGTQGQIVGPVARHDERTIVFARNRSLRPGSEQYASFYEEHPEYQTYDDKRREMGGALGHVGSIDKPGGDVNAAAAFAGITIPMHLAALSAVNPAPFPLLKDRPAIRLTPEEATRKVKGYARQIGADLVGIAELSDLWVYSHRGEIFHENWEDWGREIHVSHPYAIVIAMEMDFEMVGSAPHTPTLFESMNNYSKGAFLSSQLAAFVANLGYSATASHFRHYELVLPPLAVDAGLGEVGRLGYLMTKEFGPRIRLAAVTTDLPMVPDRPVDIGVKDFCRICKKCAVCCPSQSIPLGDPWEVNGSVRWKLNEETCFAYWGKIGTDCNICMRVCPWSHARTPPHRLIVELVSRNRSARRLFARMDDLFYGNKPRAKTGPEWTRFE
jgi:reductive dehalogenase